MWSLEKGQVKARNFLIYISYWIINNTATGREEYSMLSYVMLYKSCCRGIFFHVAIFLNLKAITQASVAHKEKTLSYSSYLLMRSLAINKTNHRLEIFELRNARLPHKNLLYERDFEGYRGQDFVIGEKVCENHDFSAGHSPPMCLSEMQ